VLPTETIESLAPTLAYLHEQASKLPSLNVTYNLYLTQPPRPLPSGPPSSLPSSTTLQPYRPSISQLVQECLPPPTLPELEDGKGMRTCCSHGGVIVVACGPESIVAESRNAVAGLGIGDRVRAGGVEFFGECYAI
jgi:ferric-chelate reductase